MNTEYRVVPDALLQQLAQIENRSEDDPNGSGSDKCPVCCGQGNWNWKAGRVVSIDPIDHYPGCALEGLRAVLAAPMPPAGGESEVLAIIDDSIDSGIILTTHGAVFGVDGAELVDRAHVTRLQAEVAELSKIVKSIDKILRGNVNDPDPLPHILPGSFSITTTYGIVAGFRREREALRAELAKARELLQEADNWVSVLRQHGYHQTRALSGQIEKFIEGTSS